MTPAHDGSAFKSTASMTNMRSCLRQNIYLTSRRSCDFYKSLRETKKCLVKVYHVRYGSPLNRLPFRNKTQDVD